MWCEHLLPKANQCGKYHSLQEAPEKCLCHQCIAHSSAKSYTKICIRFYVWYANIPQEYNLLLFQSKLNNIKLQLVLLHIQLKVNLAFPLTCY